MPLRMIADALDARGGRYSGGDQPDALDVYAATFLTPVEAPLDDCPGVAPPLRAAFAAAHDAFASLVRPALLEHRTQMFAEHLDWPIVL
jgi:predicted component of type VI protein secretion system